MDKILIEGIPGLDGEYEIDVSYFTNREMHLIKRIAGVRGGELDEAFRSGDTDIIVAVAAIALQRNGKQADENKLWDAPVGSLRYIAAPAPQEESDGDAFPPAQTPPGSSESGGSESGSATSSEAPSGSASTVPSEPPVNGQSSTGAPASATGATSPPPISAI